MSGPGIGLRHSRRWHRFNKSNLVGFDLEEASGSRVSSIGSISLAATGAPGNATGRTGNGVSLVAASSQYLSVVNSHFDPGDSDYSISLWVNFTSVQSFPPQIMLAGCIGPGGFDEEWQLWARGGNDFVFTVAGHGGLGANRAYGSSDAISSGAPATGTWYHVVGTFTTGDQKARIYRNGVLGTVGAASATTPIVTGGTFYLGQNYGGYYTGGLGRSCSQM
jgi:hypothetical protein